MKKLSLKIVLLLLIIQNSFGQFHKFINASGFIVFHGASISHIATAGGGVVLRGVAKPKYPDSLSAFTNITFDETKGLSTMYIQTQGSNISFSDTSWLMRDAAMLVKSEDMDTAMYRDVNLFGSLTDEDNFNIEMADSLVKTKSGQTLLYMDIMLTDSANARYYSSNTNAYNKYMNSEKLVMKLIEDHNDSITLYNDSVGKYDDSVRLKLINDTYFKLKNFDSLSQSGKLDSSEVSFLNKIKQVSFYNLFNTELEGRFAYSYVDTVYGFYTEKDM